MYSPTYLEKLDSIFAEFMTGQYSVAELSRKHLVDYRILSVHITKKLATKNN